MQAALMPWKPCNMEHFQTSRPSREVEQDMLGKNQRHGECGIRLYDSLSPPNIRIEYTWLNRAVPATWWLLWSHSTSVFVV